MRKSINKKTLLFTHPVFIIGSYDDNDNPNIMAVSWGGICCSEPPCVTISLRKSRYSFSSIMKHQAFTLNIPSGSQVSEADFTGIYSGRDMNKFEKLNLTALESSYVHAPYIKEFPMHLSCKVIHTYEIGIHTQFIGEILDVSCEESYLNKKGMPDIAKIDPFIFDSSGRSYYGIGRELISAYSTIKK